MKREEKPDPQPNATHRRIRSRWSIVARWFVRCTAAVVGAALLFVIDILATDSFVDSLTVGRYTFDPGILGAAAARVYQFQVSNFLSVRIFELQIAMAVVLYPLVRSWWEAATLDVELLKETNGDSPR